MLSGNAEFNKAASKAYKTLKRDEKDELMESTTQANECKAYKTLKRDEKDELMESTTQANECDDKPMSIKDVKKAAKIFKKVSNLVRMWQQLNNTVHV